MSPAAMDLSRRQSVQRRLSTWKKRTLTFGPQNGLTSQITTNGDAHTTSENRTIFQGFEWYTTSLPTLSHWRLLTLSLPHLKAIGIDQIWLPPGCKASSPTGNGYDIYDLYDLGEFSAKGTTATKWGSRDDLVRLCEEAKRMGFSVIWDAVLNHRAAGDEVEEARAVVVDGLDRRMVVGSEKKVETWTRFTYPGRKGMYSGKEYTHADFSGIDYDAIADRNDILRFTSPGTRKGWAEDVDKELGNYDYLMFANVDYAVTAVREDVLNWARWIVSELGLGGMRLDAMKHYSQSFQRELVKTMEAQFGKEFFLVGEYWSSDSLVLSNIIGKFKGRLSLFDVQLVYNFSDISKEKQGDLRKVFDGALVTMHPQRSVTFVANHDTQEGQSLEAVVEEWFVPHAYALILLRGEGVPTVFWGDVFGMRGPRPRRPGLGGRLVRLVSARKRWAYGKQKDYFDQVDCVGWVRGGDRRFSDGAGLAVLLNSAWEANGKKMYVGASHAGEKWTDILGWAWGDVEIDEFGEGLFPVGPRSISVWTAKDAKGRNKVDNLVMDSIPGEEKEREKGKRRASVVTDHGSFGSVYSNGSGSTRS